MCFSGLTEDVILALSTEWMLDETEKLYEKLCIVIRINDIHPYCFY